MEQIIAMTFVFNAIDFLTGILKGLKVDSKIISSKLRDGLFKKAGFAVIYILVYSLSKANNVVGLQLPHNTTQVVCVYIIFTEVISILENVCVLNPKLKQNKLIKLLGIDKEITND